MGRAAAPIPLPAADVRHWLKTTAGELAEEQRARGETAYRAARGAISDFWSTVPPAGTATDADLLATLQPMIAAADARLSTLKNLAATVTLNAGLVRRGLPTTFVIPDGAEV